MCLTKLGLGSTGWLHLPPTPIGRPNRPAPAPQLRRLAAPGAQGLLGGGALLLPGWLHRAGGDAGASGIQGGTGGIRWGASTAPATPHAQPCLLLPPPCPPVTPYALAPGLPAAGVAVDPSSARYVASQPWPFPSSLMIGFIADAAPAGGAAEPPRRGLNLMAGPGAVAACDVGLLPSEAERYLLPHLPAVQVRHPTGGTAHGSRCPAIAAPWSTRCRAGFQVSLAVLCFWL